MNLRAALWATALVAVICCAAVPTVVWAQAGTGLASSPHDFSTVSTSSVVPIGMCTRCHTPHRALQTHLLWNHALSTNTFSWDVPTTTAGTTLPTNVEATYQGSTTKCLSCHDGSVGTGQVAWFEEQGPRDLSTSTSVIGSTSGISQGFGGVMNGIHPVAVPYPYLGVANTYNGATTAANYAQSGGIPPQWFNQWLQNPPYPIRLFNDDGSGHITAGASAGRTGIECTSCHDVHNDEDVPDPNNVGDTRGYNYLLRGKLTGNVTGGGPSGYICEGCHNK